MSKISASEGVHAFSVRGVGRLALVCLSLGVGVSAVGLPYGDLHAMPDAGLVHQFRLPPLHGGT